MKADGGALIYIIIAVVVAIVNAVTKSKKKEITPAPSKPYHEENPEPQKTPQTTWQKELEDIFGELPKPEVVIEKPAYEAPEPKTKPEPEIKAEPSMVDQWNKYQASNKMAEPELIPMEIDEHVHKSYSEPEPLPLDLEEFELRKAVIYSEVINRKYF
jgi:hypothetical protein